MELNLLYVHSFAMGYGRLGSCLADELRKMDVTVYDELPDPRLDPNRERSWADGHNQGVSQVACWVSTPSHARGWFRQQTPVLFSMWEATRLPPSFTENLSNFETVIVPSRQNVELFSRFHPDVRFLPLGVDPDLWHYTPRKAPSVFFDFLIGGSGARKGTMLAHDAFVKVFGDDRWEHGTGPIPRLLMKSPRGEEQIGHHRVQMISGRLSADEEVNLYANAHCYLQPSRGEGFGLQPLQAIAQGMPTILTAAHGHDSFAHLGYGLSSTLTPAAYFIYGDAGDWWEPDFDELCDCMLYVYDHYDAACEVAKDSARTVAQQFTWRHCADGLLDILGRDRLTALDAPRTVDNWHVPTMRLYQVVTQRDHWVDVGGTQRFYKKGETYWEPADVKRILFDSSLNGGIPVLDPSCLQGDDTGLTADQLGAVDSYSAACSYCPACNQRLNSQPTRADDMFAKL